MKTLTTFLCLTFAVLLFSAGEGFALPPCQGDDESKLQNCKGILTSHSGKEYVGVFKDGIFDGVNAELGVGWVGGYKNGTMYGQGTFIFADGGRYVGEVSLGGKSHGQGTYLWGDGSKYVGEWRDNTFYGQGTYTYVDGTVLEGIWDGDEVQIARKAQKDTRNFFLWRVDNPLGSVATTDEICELLTVKFFSHPLEAYKKVFGGSGGFKQTVSWDGTAKGAMWLKEKTKGWRDHPDKLNLSHETHNLANKNLSDCLYRLDKSNPNVYQVLEKYFLVYLQSGEKCFEQGYRIDERIDDFGNITEQRIPVEKNERKQCLNLTYGDAYVGNWNYSTLPILLVWSEGHSILRTILDWGDQHLVTRFNELRKEETARAEKSAEKEKQQVRLKREREERSSFERKESQRSEAANDNIRLALNVLNFTLKADKHSRDGAIAASTQECTFYVFDMFGKQTLYVDNIILNTVQFYSKLIWNDWLEQYQKRHYVEFSGDERVWNENSSGKIFLDIDADLQRVQKAWSLLFSKYCEGASTDEF